MSSPVKGVLRFGACLVLAGGILGTAALPLSAQVSIPQGSTIDSAVFSVYQINNPTYQVVSLHRIVADWGELSVTWASFANQYDPSVVGSFTTDQIGWHAVDVTALVQAWVNGVPNFGIAMRQGMSVYNIYHSSEAAYPLLAALRPKLEIDYTTPLGAVGHAVIQRPELAREAVADATISELSANYNMGNDTPIYTGDVHGYEKYSLVRFDFTVQPPSPGVGTPGYWMNHLNAWPEDGIVIGGRYYTKEQAYILMKKPVATDKTYSMFAALVAAKLNVMIGNDAGCIADTIAAADNWMVTYYVGSGVAAGGETSPWRVGEPLFLLLDAYNNGLLCAPARD